MISKRQFWLMPPQVLWLLLLAAGIAHFVLGMRLQVARSLVAGGALVAAGVAVNLWSSRLFDRSRTPIRPDAIPQKLVEFGPFRWSRNPMYLGLTLFLVGIALLVGSLPFWILPIPYALLLRLVFIPHEERALRAAFGTDYEDYCRRVSRWFGRR